MSKGYWVRGHRYKTPDKTTYEEDSIIHRFDTLKEAEFFKSEVAHGEILDWGDGEEYNKKMHVKKENRNMSIKKINAIPTPAQRLSQRSLIVADVREAVQNGISQFEFDGDMYNYKTLAGNARDAVKKWFRQEVYGPALNNVYEQLGSREYTTSKGCYEYSWEAYSISQRKMEDRVHVYCTLDLDIINNMEKLILEDIKENQ